MTSLACLALAALLCLMLYFGMRALGSWLADRAVARALARSVDAPQARLMPESQFVVRLSESEVSCQRPDGGIETVRWDELERVVIHTTSDGPLLPDCFWLLIGSGTSGCCIPWGASGGAELLARLQQLPGFDNQAVIGTGTQEAVVTCWQRQTNAGE
ncbi:hypothetical protein [Prosthecobacter vanneervenii]|uniref:Uncharacterized protein n=1 Tax=Prosthecobacter vanneervenii TaxID=48466 RepID=A0A7W7YEA7_9BACT|nr:hypothetical protein [Prosthecobacter vanneervenii]MBB5034598.1 hypothetical protein [Prosthecobacter vanneervenii]